MVKDIKGRDFARRDALLGISGETDSGGIVQYEGLDVERLGTLIDECFADPEQAQNGSPTIGEFYAFLQAHPEARAYGYAVDPARDDCRVSIEGLTADLTKVIPSRREALRTAFAHLCESAEGLQIEGDALHSWWD
jgi:hypothetical protein